MSWKKIEKIARGFTKTTKFWDPKAVKKGVKQQWAQDPLGRQLNKLMDGFSSRPSSAGGYNTWSQGVYGHTGSIVGRY